MKFDTEGTYTLLYTATDECGNETEETREVIVGNPRTVLYTDGTFIINELPRDKARNEALHGVATNEYIPFDPNGSGANAYDFGSSANDRPWNGQSASVLSVKIGSPISPVSTAQWFRYFSNCVDFDFNNLNMSDCTNVNSMFGNCTSLARIDISDWNMQNVTSAMGMFEKCTALESANLSQLDLKKVTSIRDMFNYCTALKSVNLEGVATRDVTSMQSMFSGCGLLNVIDLSSFNLEKMRNMAGAFAYCREVTDIVLPNTFTSALRDVSDMCPACSKLKNINLLVLDTSNVTTMSGMFSSCTALETVDISSFTTTALSNISNMFAVCTSLKTIYATALFDGSNISSKSLTFDGDELLVGGAGTAYISNYKSGVYARIDNPPDAPGYFTLKTN